MKLDDSLKLKIVAGLIILIALQSNIKNCIKEIKFYSKNKGADEITKFDSQMQKLKNIIPAQKISGFVTDKKDDVKTFYLTRYALAPAIIVHGTEFRYILAVPGNPSDYMQFCKNNNLTLLEKTDNNIFLFRKNIQ
ncbi:MAG: hypothetical protein GY795_47395 [Desulfobacterales bacterium]|nr:hypothetical protein [Desulfobacterales bacterium]